MIGRHNRQARSSAAAVQADGHCRVYLYIHIWLCMVAFVHRRGMNERTNEQRDEHGRDMLSDVRLCCPAINIANKNRPFQTLSIGPGLGLGWQVFCRGISSTSIEAKLGFGLVAFWPAAAIPQLVVSPCRRCVAIRSQLLPKTRRIAAQLGSGYCQRAPKMRSWSTRGPPVGGRQRQLVRRLVRYWHAPIRS